MFRFILSFLAGFGAVYYLLKREDKIEKENINKKSTSLKFPPEPEGLKEKDSFLELLRTFNKIKKDV